MSIVRINLTCIPVVLFTRGIAYTCFSGHFCSFETQLFFNICDLVFDDETIYGHC